ncbi:MAG TPA: hypothetical protein DEO65_12030 [Bacillus bacterium]|nr:hypothetical protein [Bacillus sp. (in: firmicutes)]
MDVIESNAYKVETKKMSKYKCIDHASRPPFHLIFNDFEEHKKIVRSLVSPAPFIGFIEVIILRWKGMDKINKVLPQHP